MEVCGIAELAKSGSGLIDFMIIRGNSLLGFSVLIGFVNDLT